MSVRVQRGETFAGYSDLEVRVCGECGVLFAMPEVMVAARRRDGEDFYCPNGHCRVFRETDADRLQRELAASRDRAARLSAEREQLRASLSAQRGQTTKARNERDRMRARAAVGVCPCCGRTFKQLARHMKAKHPEFGPVGEHE